MKGVGVREGKGNGDPSDGSMMYHIQHAATIRLLGLKVSAHRSHIRCFMTLVNVLKIILFLNLLKQYDCIVILLKTAAKH